MCVYLFVHCVESSLTSSVACYLPEFDSIIFSSNISVFTCNFLRSSAQTRPLPLWALLRRKRRPCERALSTPLHNYIRTELLCPPWTKLTLLINTQTAHKNDQSKPNLSMLLDRGIKNTCPTFINMRLEWTKTEIFSRHNKEWGGVSPRYSACHWRKRFLTLSKYITGCDRAGFDRCLRRLRLLKFNWPCQPKHLTMNTRQPEKPVTENPLYS